MAELPQSTLNEEHFKTLLSTDTCQVLRMVLQHPSTAQYKPKILRALSTGNPVFESVKKKYDAVFCEYISDRSLYPDLEAWYAKDANDPKCLEEYAKQMSRPDYWQLGILKRPVEGDNILERLENEAQLYLNIIDPVKEEIRKAWNGDYTLVIRVDTTASTPSPAPLKPGRAPLNPRRAASHAHQALTKDFFLSKLFSLGDINSKFIHPQRQPTLDPASIRTPPNPERASPAAQAPAEASLSPFISTMLTGPSSPHNVRKAMAMEARSRLDKEKMKAEKKAAKKGKGQDR